MKKWTHNLIFLVALLAVALSSGNTRAQEEKPTASADVGVFSKYMWRGWELSDDSIVIQPSVTVGYRGFSLNLWGNSAHHIQNRFQMSGVRCQEGILEELKPEH